MKKLLPFIVASLLLSGCSINQEPKGELTGMTVESKRVVEECFRGCFQDYFVLFKRDSSRVELHTKDQNIYNLFHEGSVVNVTYSEEYEILDFSLPEQKK